jgi:hypothetical protein
MDIATEYRALLPAPRELPDDKQQILETSDPIQTDESVSCRSRTVRLLA